jgi:gamma-glutamyltranspeptidase/glutathione hydrolase
MNTVDKNGLGVSLIQSNFHGIGSRIGVGNYGFFLHNRGCGFNLDQQHPNFLKAGNKPLHTLSPTLWSKDDNLEFIIGTRGGRYQPQLLVQAILPYLLNLESFENIIKKPRWVIDYFSSNKSSKIKFEEISENEIDFLKTKDHEVTNENGYKNAYGPISVIYKDKKDIFQGVADIRVGTEKVFSSL